MATIYNKPQLLRFIADAVNESGWNIIYLNDVHPFKVKIFNDTDSYLVKIIIYNITHGGGRARAANEYRVQIKEPVLAEEAPYKTLILGYYEQLNVFAGWDLSKHLGSPGYSASFQIRAENLEAAVMNGFSPCDKGNAEIAIAFRPDFFVEYVRNLASLHSFGESPTDFEILENVSENGDVEINQDIIDQVSEPRRVTIHQVSRRQRDNSFRARVLRAYNNRCAFSGTQLKLVDAAHIVPVEYDTSTDETCNGIALSSIYHRAYDVGLITFIEQDNYRIIINEEETHRLTELGLDGGLQRFLDNLRPVIDPPPSVTDRPNAGYVRTANELRGWRV